MIGETCHQFERNVEHTECGKVFFDTIYGRGSEFRGSGKDNFNINVVPFPLGAYLLHIITALLGVIMQLSKAAGRMDDGSSPLPRSDTA